jgi:adenylate cyclase
MVRGKHISAAGTAPFVVLGFLIGLLYNTLFYPRTLVEYAEAGTIGVLLGAAVGIVEQLPTVRRWFQRRSLAHAVVVRTLLYSTAVAFCLSLVLAVEPAGLGQCHYLACLVSYVAGPLFVRDLGFSTALVFALTVGAQVVFLIGPRNLARLAIGRYRRPREVGAEFMLVDLRASTRIAEDLGHERYSALLRDFFTDTARAIHESRGEIYQYVGDEVVIVWLGARASGRWLGCFIEMRAVIAAQRVRYLDRYGVAPEFKAGVHGGEVIATEVGVLQRAFVYHGDVLNTAARIQAKCNETRFDLLASRDALSTLAASEQGQFELIGHVSIHGKARTVELYGLTSSRKGQGSA